MRIRGLALILMLSLLSGQGCLPVWAQAPPGSSKKSSSKRKSSKRAPVNPRRVRRVRRAFVASAELKPMARQLLQDRSPAAYAGVGSYAARHKDDEAGALAWLVAGYARLLDKQPNEAIEALKKARPHAEELSDYVDYYLASAYSNAGQFPAAVSVLRGFETKYPDSLLRKEALTAYANALISTGQEQEAIRLLEAHRTPQRADVELALGRAYSAAGQPVKATQTLRRIYFTMPLSAEAGDAEALLKTLASVPGVPPATFEEHKTRAQLLAQARRWGDAIGEYRALLKQAPAEDAPTVQVALASALWHGGRSGDARQTLERMPPVTGEANAQRLYIILEIERPEQNRVEATLSDLRANHARSPWFQEGLLSAANMYLLQQDYDHAANLYAELQQRFPMGRYGAYAHWKAAWLKFRQGRRDEAKSLFEQQVELYATSQQVVPSLYWRARLAEEEGDYPRARAWYQKIQERFRYYYYAELARERLKAMPAGEAARDPLLERIPRAAAVSGYKRAELPADDLRAQKSLLLENGALFELSIRELQAADASGDAPWALARIAYLYQEQDRYDRALQTLKRAIPGYFGLDLEQLPRPFWEALFPRPWWNDLKRYATENQLDPYLVAALVRQESEFNPEAVSRADAIGLMQLLPRTGKKLARDLKVRRYSVGMLTEPALNLQLGTRYFRQLLEHFDGGLEYALAAYNAGSDRVEEWRANGKYRDTAEFVESIPFTETREYVQAILRNAQVYRRLYGTP